VSRKRITSTEADRHLAGVQADHAAADDHDLGGFHAGHAAKQYAGATPRLL
jgi:hypothetical protein